MITKKEIEDTGLFSLKFFHMHGYMYYIPNGGVYVYYHDLSNVIVGRLECRNPDFIINSIDQLKEIIDDHVTRSVLKSVNPKTNKHDIYMRKLAIKRHNEYMEDQKKKHKKKLDDYNNKSFIGKLLSKNPKEYSPFITY